MHLRRPINFKIHILFIPPTTIVDHTMDMDAKQEHLQQSVDATIDSIDKQHFRSIRKTSFLCSATCCDTSSTHMKLNECVNTCEQRMINAESILQQELNQFQQRLQRCALSCRDNVMAKVNTASPPNENQMKEFQSAVDKCVSTCIDESISSLGPLKKRVDGELAKLR
jgi:hypothetical protein